MSSVVKRSGYIGIQTEKLSTTRMKKHRFSPSSHVQFMRLIVWTILRRAGRHKIKRLATDTMHVKSQKVRNWKPQPQTPTRTLQLTGISSKHRGTRSNLCSYVYEPCLPEAMQKRILSRTWLKETVIAVPEAILCL